MSAGFRPGDVVVYRKQKNSLHPGPHARDIHPAAHGDFYSYLVEKFCAWLPCSPTTRSSSAPGEGSSTR